MSLDVMIITMMAMMEFLPQMQSIAVWLGLAAVVILCAAGILLSCLSISGTWLVIAGTILAAVIKHNGFPGLWTILIFIVLAAFVEVVEALSGALGVRRRGGSKLAGIAAVVGGLLGLILGTLIPVPILGNLLGMLIGGFSLVFAVERYRLKKSAQAADIAWGAVLARVFIMLLKVSVSLGMTAFLFVGMAVQS